MINGKMTPCRKCSCSGKWYTKTVSKAILKILRMYTNRLPPSRNKTVGFNLPEKAITNAMNRIMTLMALQPSMIRATYFPWYMIWIKLCGLSSMTDDSGFISFKSHSVWRATPFVTASTFTSPKEDRYH